MKIIIEIPDHVYEHAKNMSEDSNDEYKAMRAIAKGFPYNELEKSCLNCGTSECELGNRARYGFCGNWTMREGEQNE